MPGTLGALNAINAPDAYTVQATLDGGMILDHINLDVINQGVYWQIRQIPQVGFPPQSASWQPEVFMAPGSRTIDRAGMVGVRVRAATPLASLPAGTLRSVATVEAVLQ